MREPEASAPGASDVSCLNRQTCRTPVGSERADVSPPCQGDVTEHDAVAPADERRSARRTHVRRSLSLPTIAPWFPSGVASAPPSTPFPQRQGRATRPVPRIG